MNTSTSAWSGWLEKLQARLELNDTEMAARLGVSAMTYWGWKNKGTTPRHQKHLDKLIEVSGEDKSHVYQLAGRGYIGIELDNLSAEIAGVAYEIQAGLDAIEDLDVREFRKGELIEAIRKWREDGEKLSELVENLLARKRARE